MKDDNFMLFTYDDFVNETLPLFSLVRTQEKGLTAQANIFNRKKIHAQIAQAYDNYASLVKNYWEAIYSTHEEYINTSNKAFSVLYNKKTIYAKTKIQYYVEQFFFAWVLTISEIALLYRDKVTMEECKKAQEASTEYIKEIMDLIQRERQEKTSPEKNKNTERIKAISQLQEMNKEVIGKSRLWLHEISLTTRQYMRLSHIGITILADLCTVNPESLVALEEQELIDIFAEACEISKLKPTIFGPDGNPSDGKNDTSLVEIKAKAVSFAKCIISNLNPEILEIERDFERIAMVPNLFVDFNAFERRWLKVEKQAENANQEMKEFHDALENDIKKNNPEVRKYLLFIKKTKDAVYAALTYSKVMCSLMENLDKKAHGGDYTIESYQIDEHNSERQKGIYQKKYDEMNIQYKNTLS